MLGTTTETAKRQADDTAHLNQFILHSAMDMVDDAAESTNNMSAIFAASAADQLSQVLADRRPVQRSERFRIHHSRQHSIPPAPRGSQRGPGEDFLPGGLRSLRQGVFDPSAKTRTSSSPPQLLMNPFYTYDTPILSSSFEQRIQAIARRYL